MANYTGPKVKIARALGIATTAKAGRILEKKGYPPGEHGGTTRGRRTRKSDFGIQLLEKQRLRAQYNITERQMRRYYLRARQLARTQGSSIGDALVRQLEMRLDALVLRGGLAPTIYAARQLVSHGHILVNGKPVDIPSCPVNVGDEASVKQGSRDLPVVLESIGAGSPTPYIAVDRERFAVRLTARPGREQVPVVGDVARVVEYYAR